MEQKHPPGPSSHLLTLETDTSRAKADLPSLPQPRMRSVSTEAAPACGPSARPAPGQNVSRGPGSRGAPRWAGAWSPGGSTAIRASLATHGQPPPCCVLTSSPPLHWGGGAQEAACCLMDNLLETPQTSSCKASSGWSADARLGAHFSFRIQTFTLVYTHSPGS